MIENHLTLGGTRTLANKNELTVGCMHAFKQKVNGSKSIPLATPVGGFLGGGEANLHMLRDSLGVACGIRFQ